MFFQFKVLRYLGPFIIVLSVGCASKVPQPINEKIINMPLIQTVAQNIDGHIGQRVRWGGIIVNMVNEKDASLVEIVHHPLNGQGRPLATDQTQGRFLARVTGFLDPVVFAPGREITIIGTIDKKTKQFIDQFEYTYPEVLVASFVLWQRVSAQKEYYYDPFLSGYWYPHHDYGPLSHRYSWGH